MAIMGRCQRLDGSSILPIRTWRIVMEIETDKIKVPTYEIDHSIDLESAMEKWRDLRKKLYDEWNERYEKEKKGKNPLDKPKT